MYEKFGLEFQPIENSAALDRAQTAVSEGLQPWAYYDRVITSVEYLKRRDVYAAALAHPWDVIVVDEAHYLAESGTPANPYSTARNRLGPKLREHARTLLLLTATPHNGYRHSFRSLLELVEPAEATLHGTIEDVRKRVGRTMIRRLKSQIVKTGAGGMTVPAFPVRVPVERIEVKDLTGEEREIFRLVTDYCAKTIKSAAGSEEEDLVSFAMQIVKKRMLSSRAALHRTVENRLDALAAKKPEEPPKRLEVRELQSDLPLPESQSERTALRVLRSAISRDARRHAAEKKQLATIKKLLEQVAGRPDPKITGLMADLERNVLPVAGEKAIVFTEYRDTLAALRDAFTAHPQLRDGFVELTGGLTARQRRSRITRFNEASCRVLLATDAASEGLNLQGHCCRLYHFELPWNPNRLEQRNGRIDRHGQTRPPIIRYLFYPDSPEDRVLDRLVQRIAAMHDDRVSTPDILGIMEGSRLEEILGKIESLVDGEKKGESLMRLFETRRQEFSEQIAPLLFGVAEEESPLPYARAISADPLMTDDVAFERLMCEVLQGALCPTKIPETWRIDVPRHFQGPGVASRYECATFRRSVAIQYPADQIEFIHRLHPLTQAIGEHALRELTLEPARNQFAARIAVRRHRAVKQPVALFTFLEKQSHPKGAVFGITVTSAGEVLDRDTARVLLESDADATGEVLWSECERVFAKRFASIQQKAAAAALNGVRAELERQRSRRTKLAEVVRDEAERYKIDRLAEIDEQEKFERAGAREQTELFRETATNWKARRAAVETYYQRRLEEIDRFARTCRTATSWRAACFSNGLAMALASIHNRRGFFSDYWLGTLFSGRGRDGARVTPAQARRTIDRLRRMLDTVGGVDAPDLTHFRERFARPLIEEILGFSLRENAQEPRLRPLTTGDATDGIFVAAVRLGPQGERFLLHADRNCKLSRARSSSPPG
jgi:superfamily II DNA or RNA helicase